jgi:nicotinamidase-related amidase
MSRTHHLAALALFAVAALALRGQTPVLAQRGFSQVPATDVLAVPDPVAVSLDASTTAFLAIDLLQSGCALNPICVATLPAVAAGLAAARAANALVLESTHLPPDIEILPDVAPAPGDIVFAAPPGGDKFFNSDLDDILKQAGIKTLVLTGQSSNQGVLYTASAAGQRGITVVVAEDGISATTDLATSVALWQMLNGPRPNPRNVPLQANSVTLSRTDLITYK